MEVNMDSTLEQVALELVKVEKNRRKGSNLDKYTNIDFQIDLSICQDLTPPF